MTRIEPPAAGEPISVTVFAAGPGGGNPAPIVLDARAMSDEQMRSVACSTGHECGFVVEVPAGVEADIALRFWVPNHEMSMCGHATVAAVWLLDRVGALASDRIVVHTDSGLVSAHIDAGRVSVSQPVGHVDLLDNAGAELVARVLKVAPVAPGVRNARTSRVKTLVPVADAATLNALAPDPSEVERACTAVGSSGLYPYAVLDLEHQVVAARQFPRSSGYPEDPATGVAAAALAFGLLDAGLVDAGRAVVVRQGDAMGQPSQIDVDFDFDTTGTVVGCRISGECRLAAAAG